MTEADYRQQEELEQERRERTLRTLSELLAYALFDVDESDERMLEKHAAFLAGELGLSKEWENR